MKDGRHGRDSSNDFLSIIDEDDSTLAIWNHKMMSSAGSVSEPIRLYKLVEDGLLRKKTMLTYSSL